MNQHFLRILGLLIFLVVLLIGSSILNEIGGKLKPILIEFNTTNKIIKYNVTNKKVNEIGQKPKTILKEFNVTNKHNLTNKKLSEIGQKPKSIFNKVNITNKNIKHNVTQGNSSQTQGNNTTNKPVFAIAIFSRETSTDKRKCVRETWLSTISQTPFNIKYKFLLDRPTNETEKERQLYHDIIYTNMSAALSGYAVCFSTRMLTWYKYAVANFPNAELIGKMDDDVHPCSPQLFERIFKVRNKRLYYGWKHGGNAQKITRLTRVDEMFVVLGKELVDRIVKRKYCGCFVNAALSAECNKRNSPDELASDPYADMAISMWLSHYNDVVRVSDNRLIAHFSYEFADRVRNHQYAVPEFCVRNLIFHKSSMNIMYKLHHYNMYFRAGNRIPSVESLPSGYSRPAPLTLSTFTKGKPVDVKDKFGNKWVVFKAQTVFTPSFCSLMQFFISKNWSVVIIGDYGSAADNTLCNANGNLKSHLVFLHPHMHEIRFPALSDALFWNHFGRRNIGFVYAMHHGAKFIFDFYHEDNLASCIENAVQNFTTNSFKKGYRDLKCGGSIWSCSAFKAMALPISFDRSKAHIYRSAIANLFLGNSKHSSSIQASNVSNITKTITRTLTTVPSSIKTDIEGIYKYLYTKGLIEYDDVAFSKIWMKSVFAQCV